MAIYKPGALISSLSGSIAGVNFANTKSGPVVRPRAIKTNPQTAKQATARAHYTQAVRLWATLTTAQQNLWKLAATQYPQTNRLGAARPLSGFQLFVKNAIATYTTSHTPVSNTPAPLVYSPLTSVTLDYKSGTYLNATWTIAIGVYPTAVSLYGMRGFNRQTNWTPRNFLFFRYLAPTAYPAVTDIKTYFENAFGIPNVGETIWISSLPTNQLSFLAPRFTAKATVHA